MLTKLAATVIVCFSLLWAPYLSNVQLIMQVLHRLFPVGRGLYEDKVANFWCTVSPVSFFFTLAYSFLLNYYILQYLNLKRLSLM